MPHQWPSCAQQIKILGKLDASSHYVRLGVNHEAGMGHEAMLWVILSRRSSTAQAEVLGTLPNSLQESLDDWQVPNSHPL